METPFKNNEEAIEYAKRFVDNELIGFFKKIEKEKLFGSLHHHPNGKAKAEFVFNDGICLRCIEPLKGQANTFLKSTKFW